MGGAPSIVECLQPIVTGAVDTRLHSKEGDAIVGARQEGGKIITPLFFSLQNSIALITILRILFTESTTFQIKWKCHSLVSGEIAIPSTTTPLIILAPLIIPTLLITPTLLIIPSHSIMCAT